MNRATVKDILQNNLYTGKIRWNRRKVGKEFVDGSLQRVKKRRVREEYLIVDGKHPALITEELFNEAQELFVGQVPVKANTTVINPLARLMYCKHCGKAVGLQAYKKRRNNTTKICSQRIGDMPCQIIVCK